MKAMILAAGLGTRLKPLTDRIPKALVEIEGVTMIERVIRTLKLQGFDYIVINVHHFSNQVTDFLNSREFGVEIHISDESEELLDTGGGIVKAAPLLFRKNDNPVLIHNVDILSNAELNKLVKESDETSSLLVSDRESSRKLVFGPDRKLKGWKNLTTNSFLPSDLIIQPDDRELSFSGIYVLNRKTIEEMEKLKGRGKFPIMDYFLDERRKEIIQGIEARNLKILDIGKPATLLQAADMILNM